MTARAYVELPRAGAAGERFYTADLIVRHEYVCDRCGTVVPWGEPFGVINVPAGSGPPLEIQEGAGGNTLLAASLHRMDLCVPCSGLLASFLGMEAASG